MREGHDLFETFMHHSPATAFVKDEEGRMLYVNKAFEEQVWDGNPPDWRNRTDAELWAPESARQFRDNDLRVMRSGRPEVMEEVLVKNGTPETWLSFKFLLRRHSGERCLAGMAINVTETRKTEEARRKLEARLLQAQKLESLAVLAGGVAHDFNNLLTAMLGNASLAQPLVPPGSEVQRMLREIEVAARRAGDLARQMLAYSGRGRFVIEALRVDAIVGEMAKLLETAVANKVGIRLQLKPAPVMGDATQIRQIVMNLITNASEALGGEGEIVLRTGTRRMSAAELQSPHLHQDLPEGRYSWIEVQDSGCGMSAETLARIFDPFFTTKFTGRGLGLAAVLGIVRGHGGTIQVDSTPGKGTTFRLLIPCTAAAAAEAAESRPEAGSWRGTGTVLVVEDEAGVRSFACAALERAGFQVRQARNGREGLKIFEKHPGEFRAVLLDLTMPRLDGSAVLQRLHGLRPDLPVLLMSGYSEPDLPGRPGGLHPSAFIAKPFRGPDLIAALKGILNS